MKQDTDESPWLKLYTGLIVHLPYLSGAEVMTYIALRSHMNRVTGLCFPALKTLAAETGLTEKTVKGAARRLRQMGLISAERTKTGKSNQYTFHEIASDGKIKAPSVNEAGVKSTPAKVPYNANQAGVEMTPGGKNDPEGGGKKDPQGGGKNDPEAGGKNDPPNQIKVTTGLNSEEIKEKNKSAALGGLSAHPPAALTHLTARVEVELDEIPIICSSLRNIELYLTYGADKVIHPELEITPSKLNWRTVIKSTSEFTEANFRPDEWSIQQMVGFFWFRVSIWYHERGIGLGLPIIPEITKRITQLRQRHISNWQTIQYLNTITFDFDLICSMVGTCAKDYMLDETVLTHSLFLGSVQQFLNAGPSQKQAYRDKFAAQIEERKRLYQKQ